MNKLFLLDAYALIFRAYYAFIRAPRINSKGQNTSAVFGFVNTLEEVLNKCGATHVGVVFDPPTPTFRHEMYPEYKAQREATPEDISRAVPYIKSIIEAYRIPVIQVYGYEADDVIGTLATKAGSQDIDTYMMTPDKDYAQLVSSHVRMYKPGRGGAPAETLGVEEVNEKYSLDYPKQMIDFLGLVGDKADNIPGCPGVGEMTATKLIGEFGSIEELLANTDKLKGAQKKKVEENKELILLSKELATIKTDVPIELDMEKLKVQEANKEALVKIYEELEFRSFIEKLQSKKPTASKVKETKNYGPLFEEIAEEESELPKFENLTSFDESKVSYKLIDNVNDAKKLCDFLETQEIVSFDTETTSINAIDARLVGMSFSAAEGEAYYVAVSRETDKTQEMVDAFRPFFENSKIKKVGQNVKYDIMILAHYGMKVAPTLSDTMIAHYVLHPTLHHNMDYMAETYLGYRTIRIEELIGPKGKNQRNMADLPPSEVYRYACEDADITLRLHKVLEAELSKRNLTRVLTEIEMPLVQVLADMELCGVLIDTEALADTERIFAERLATIESSIYADNNGKAFNISSPRQVGEVLFDNLRITDKPKKTKTGQYVTSEETLESLRHTHPIVGKILDYRGLRKLLSTYVEALPKCINSRTGHIHTSFNQTVTSTGRLSSSDPNLQNIPVRGEDGREIRKAFVPEPGCLFLSADYSQIELRIMAHLSADPHMLAAFRASEDIHADTAAKVYHKAPEDVTSDERRNAKTANFGIIYGISSFGLAQRIGISRTEAKNLIDNYFTAYPAVREYMNKSIEMARDKGYVETICGRRLRLPDINSRNAVVRGFAERNAINAPIQGSAADIIKIAMARIHSRFANEGIRSKMILQVHDELNFSVLPEEKEVVESIVRHEMETAARLSVPLQVDCGWGNNWLEAH